MTETLKILKRDIERLDMEIAAHTDFLDRLSRRVVKESKAITKSPENKAG
jgi:hypothetical protein